MKNILYIALFLSYSFVGSAQQETLFSKINHISAFGGPILEYSEIDGQPTVDVGGGGALILDNFFVGGYGMGTKAPNITLNNENFDIQFKHGGFWLGYVATPQKLAHIYSSVRVGWGEANLLEGDGRKVFSDNTLVVSPEVGVDINLTSWFTVALTGGYRFVDGVDTMPAASGLDNDSFSSIFGGLTFRFGGFRSWKSKSGKKGKSGNEFDADFDF